MGLRQFNLDLKAATTICHHGVTNIRKGDSDGEVAFRYTHDDLDPIEIQALATNVDSYPKRSDFLIFTSADNTGDDVQGWLQEVAERTHGKTVMDVIALIFNKLTMNLHPDSVGISQEPNAYESDESTLQDSGYDHDFSSDEEHYQIDIDPLPPRRLPSDTVFSTQESIRRLKRHLRQARREGLAISLPSGKFKESSGIFALSVGVSKLGISEEALEAWDLKHSDYIFMLMKLPLGYPPGSHFLQLSSDQTIVQFKFGKSAKSRLSTASMREAFEHPSTTEKVDSNNGGDDVSGEFMSLYTSASLDALINQEFPSLLNIRRSQNLSWDAALAHKFDVSRGDHHRRDETSDQKVNERSRDISEDDFQASLLQRDASLAGPEDLNIALCAMQFGLRRLARCTQYCMVCHQKTEGFEAVKPFVCQSSLCLYQYISLGFGQSIEHEIVNNPYVVDLLISFFHNALCSNALREFPSGLGLKCPVTGTHNAPAPHIEVNVCFSRRSFDWGSTSYEFAKTIKEGDFFMLVVKDIDPMPSASGLISNGGLERHTCIVEYVSGASCRFRIIGTQDSPLNVLSPSEDSTVTTQVSRPSKDLIRVMLFKHETDIDSLKSPDRISTLKLMTHNIPSVLSMREYLTEQSGRTLRSWKQMDRSTLALLNWIVASNRSFIVQDGPVPDNTRRKNSIVNPNLVKGMEEDYMQFRFAQGSPEKEQKSCAELAQTHNKHRSLFAWHGSSLGNWHSIIRTGLDFAKTLNGRAYGHGVYFSPMFTTSSGYTNRQHNLMGQNSWPNSELNITAAISMCELINKPKQFVAVSPHYVVDKIEWIQCRYLFVQVKGTARASKQPFPRPMKQQALGYLAQDPLRQLVGPDSATVQIPLSAIPARRRDARTSGKTQAKVMASGSSGSARTQPALSDEYESVDDSTDKAGDDNDGYLAELDDILASDDEDENRQMVRKRRRSLSDKDMENLRPVKLTTAMQNATTPSRPPLGNSSDFQPGVLDLNTIPRLIEPTWASSSQAALQRLGRDIKDLQKTQAQSDINSLGWYVNFDNLNNMFQWIVELHSFAPELPLAKDMKARNCSSIVLEFRFGASYPISPPFVRVIHPRFLPFAQGGGGHVTAGGAICSELLTNSGWLPSLSLEKVLIEVRMNLCELDPPARLDHGSGSYGILEAIGAFRRAATAHRWQVPSDLEMIEKMATRF